MEVPLKSLAIIIVTPLVHQIAFFSITLSVLFVFVSFLLDEQYVRLFSYLCNQSPLKIEKKMIIRRSNSFPTNQSLNRRILIVPIHVPIQSWAPVPVPLSTIKYFSKVESLPFKSMKDQHLREHFSQSKPIVTWKCVECNIWWQIFDFDIRIKLVYTIKKCSVFPYFVFSFSMPTST